MRGRHFATAGTALLASLLQMGCVSVGVVGSLRTEEGLGAGWMMTASTVLVTETVELTVSHIDYGDPGEQGLFLALESYQPGRFEDPSVNGPRYGFALHSGQGDVWGAGMIFGYKWGCRRERFIIYLWPSVYAWLGEENDRFDPGVEILLRGGAGLSF